LCRESTQTLKYICSGRWPKSDTEHSYSSDIDILIITEKERIEVLEALAKEEFAEIFDLHVRKPADTEWYRRHTNLVKL
jgi:predicted nucleotidyltransferase